LSASKISLGRIEGEEIVLRRNLTTGEEIVEFRGDADIDCDGSGGNPDGDPYFQPDTTLHHSDGTALNAYEEPFVVVPPVVVTKTRRIVMGCLCLVTHLETGMFCYAVAGDLGPSRKIGEVSVACARALGINANPVSGGESNHVIGYTVFAGVAAHVAGRRYVLQKWGE
jgi:hypothetical protein